jgi:hypothetical protein
MTTTRTTHDTSPHFPDNPLTFEDVAYGIAVRWCVREKPALKYVREHFETPEDALTHLERNQFPPAEFWRTL